jgi:antitoxin component YwqK of YwqJK toxin-antitoxin module
MKIVSRKMIKVKPTAQFFRSIIKNNFRVNKLLLLFFILFQINTAVFSQTFKIFNGDTINFTDNQNMKQGLWYVFEGGTNKVLQQGNYLNNLKEGNWITWYSEGNKKSEITYLSGEKKGYAKIFFENGNIAEEGYWDIDKWTGKYITYYSNGKLSYLWNYDQNGRRHGYQKYYYPDGKLKIEGEWENGKEKGIIKEYYANGTIKTQKRFIEGQIDTVTIIRPDVTIITGEENIISDSGSVSIKNDTVKIFSGNGYYIFYNKFKKIEKEGTFEDGIMIKGKQNIFDEEGSVIKVYYFENGKIVKTESPDEINKNP